MRCLTGADKLTASQLNLPHGTKNKTLTLDGFDARASTWMFSPPRRPI